MLVVDNSCKKRAKGVQKCVVKKTITHDDYRKSYFEQKHLYHDQTRISSKLHKVSTETFRKRSLSYYEDKRFWKSINESYPYGHYAISEPHSKRQKIDRCVYHLDI